MSTDPSTYWVENDVEEHLTIMNDLILSLIHGPSKAAMPTARHGLGVASIDGKICLIGGEPNPGSTVSWKNEI